MTEINVGDRVRITSALWSASIEPGTEGTVVEPDSGWNDLHVVWDHHTNAFMEPDFVWAMSTDEVEKI